MLNANTFGLMTGVVVDTQDPAGWHRVKVRVPQIHGTFEHCCIPFLLPQFDLHIHETYQ